MLFAMKPHLLPQQTQKMVLAPVMQQSIEVLLLSVVDLNLSIEQELQSNPLLEINEEAALVSSARAKEDAFYGRGLLGSSRSYRSADDETLEEIPIRIESSLEENLLQQLRVEVTDPVIIKIGEYFIGNLDEDGYLKVTCEEVAGALRIEDHALIERALQVVQGFEPLGVASRDLKECLSIQLKASRHPHREVCLKIVGNHFEDLGHKRFARISKNTGIPLAQIKEAAAFIATLEPKPARNSRPIRSSIYIQPDIFIIKDENGYHVHVSREGVPALRINAYYKNLLERPELSPKDREFILEKFRNATNFIKSIEQRGSTLRRIGEFILSKQMAFFERDEELVPMVLKDVAVALERNESTISRAINNKFIETPVGVFPIKFFFSQGIPGNPLTGEPDGQVASRSIKEEIQRLIDAENKSSPLSDQEIQNHFKARQMNIARRTISKYRQALKILPSNLRKV